MRDTSRRSLLAAFSAVPAATVAAALPLPALAHPAAPEADAGLIAQATRVMRLARLKDQAGDRLTRREEAVMDARPPKPVRPAAEPKSCTVEDHEPDLAAGIERVFTTTFRVPVGEHALAMRAYAEAVAAWEAENAKLNRMHGIEQAEDLNHNLMDRLTAAATMLSTMPATSAAGLTAKSRVYLDLTDGRGWGGEWVEALAVDLARDAARIGGQANG